MKIVNVMFLTEGVDIDSCFVQTGLFGGKDHQVRIECLLASGVVIKFCFIGQCIDEIMNQAFVSSAMSAG